MSYGQFGTYGEYRLTKTLIDMRLEEAQSASARQNLLRQAGVLQSGWLSRQACRLLYHLGHLLVALGQRLEQYAVPHSLRVNGQAGANR